MSHLVSVHAKVDRARDHLLRLDDELQAYLDADPITVVRQFQPESKMAFIAVRVKQQPPVSLSVLVGEIAHQLRSGVDHIANGLVLAAGNAPTRRTAFPVCLRPPTRLSVSGGVTAETLAQVDAVQPYRQGNPEAHPLHVLNELWNVDKHRNLHLTALMLTNTQVSLSPPDGSSMVGGQFRTTVVGDDAIIGGFRFAGGVIDSDWELTAKGSSFVALGEPGPWPNDRPVQSLLADMYTYVSKELLARFEPLLAG